MAKSYLGLQHRAVPGWGGILEPRGAVPQHPEQPGALPSQPGQQINKLPMMASSSCRGMRRGEEEGEGEERSCPDPGLFCCWFLSGLTYLFPPPLPEVSNALGRCLH